MLSFSSIGRLILCLDPSMLPTQETLDCMETKTKQINITKRKGGHRKKSVGDGSASPSVEICQLVWLETAPHTGSYSDSLQMVLAKT